MLKGKKPKFEIKDKLESDEAILEQEPSMQDFLDPHRQGKLNSINTSTEFHDNLFLVEGPTN